VSSRTRVRCLAASSILVFLLAAPAAFADRDATPDCETRAHTYSSELAAIHALTTCYTVRSANEDREYFAAILRGADGFVFVVVVGHQHTDEVSLRFDRLPGEAFVALWHTHGADGVNRELFSPTDTALVKQVGVPFYLTDPKGRLRVFRPGDKLHAPPRGRSTVRPPLGAATGTMLVANID
jgi:hypothetical protein